MKYLLLTPLLVCIAIISIFFHGSNGNRQLPNKEQLNILTNNVKVSEELYLKSKLSQQDFHRFNYLTSILRCPICANETVLEAPSKLALFIRVEILQMINEHKNNRYILNKLVDQFGNSILLLPPRSDNYLLLWLLPLLLVALSLFVFLRFIFNNRERRLNGHK
ncbi:hypothetical protein CF386_07040 [Paraphotobacterium marinum]|uniref:Cytochrome c-type biogenesis protein n=1 Tax=Paraphotobacterium marinum TaxID=1755811 RepID=A0A220VEW6_9GAMM|nr:cytochrome c-type biogenesis protein CcmH [Paraphotobacterium marinum]ASK78766.1 hypothetical protein CF386_07040 [Paraphotobacterium marinum]